MFFSTFGVFLSTYSLVFPCIFQIFFVTLQYSYKVRVMDSVFQIRTRFNGSMFLVNNLGEVSSFAFGFNSIDYARSECRQWLRQRPDLCFVSVVVGRVLVAQAGSFPFSDLRVSLAPLGC